MGLIDTIRQRVGGTGKALALGETRDLCEMSERVNEMADRALEKNLAYQDYAAWQNLDENGSYFGPEFSIRATAPRIKALFTNEPWVYVTATLIAKTLAGIPLRVCQVGTDGKTELPKHPLNAMINGGSIYQSGRHQLWTGYLDLVLGGNFFLVADQFYLSLTLAPVELVSLNLGDVSTPGPVSITVANPSKMGTRYLVPYNRVVHLRLPNPNNPFYGLSPFAAASRPLLLDRYKSEYEMAFYLRGATNNGVIETTNDISKQRFERLMRSFEQTYTGKRNWWRTLFLPKGASWKSASPTMKDMDYLESMKENRKSILSILGIPPSMVGLTEDVNYSTSEAQMQIFYDNTILPMIGFIEDGFNSSALVKTVFRGQVEVKADLTKIKAMKDQGALAVKGDIAAKVARFFTINEIRNDIFERGPAPGGDVFAISATSASSGKNPDNAVVGLAVAPEPLSMHALTFGKDLYKTPQDCSTWANAHGYTAQPVIETGTAWRIVQRGENEFQPNSFYSVQLPDSVTAIFGKVLDAGDAPQATSGGEPTGPAGEAPGQLPGKGRVSAEVKEAHGMSIMSVERSYGTAFLGVYERYLANVFQLFRRAVESRQDPRQYLAGFKHELEHAYLTDAMDVLERAQGRGYALARAGIKRLDGAVTKSGDYRFSNDDAQAIDVLEARGKKGRQAELKTSALARFDGFNATRTEQIMGLVEDGYNAGKTLEETAATIRDQYDETYPDQAYTIARTEVLSAMSSGVKAHQDDLQQVFTDVQKEWITVGDDHVRDDHDAFESLGPVAVDYEFAPGLFVPRDYGAEPGQVINCRCSLLNSIPSSAISRASAILDSDTP